MSDVGKVDFEERQRIRRSLRSKFIPQIDPKREKRLDSYIPETGAELCIMRRKGMSKRKICELTGVPIARVTKWLRDYPEFAQEWNAAYADYVVDTAEEMVPRAEALMRDLTLEGKKLSPKQHGRYMRAIEHLAQEVHWAATHRVPELYGDRENGSQFVLVQPLETTRSVTQDVDRASAWKKEIADGQTRVQDAISADGGVGDGVGGTDSDGTERGVLPGDDSVRKVVRRHPRGSRLMVKRS